MIKLDIEGAAVEVILNMLEDKIFPQQILVEFYELNKATEISLDRFFDCHYKILSNNYKLVKRSENYLNENRPKSWAKIKAIQEEFSKTNDWIFWIGLEQT